MRRPVLKSLILASMAIAVYHTAAAGPYLESSRANLNSPWMSLFSLFSQNRAPAPPVDEAVTPWEADLSGFAIRPLSHYLSYQHLVDQSA